MLDIYASGSTVLQWEIISHVNYIHRKLDQAQSDSRPNRMESKCNKTNALKSIFSVNKCSAQTISEKGIKDGFPMDFEEESRGLDRIERERNQFDHATRTLHIDT